MTNPSATPELMVFESALEDAVLALGASSRPGHAEAGRELAAAWETQTHTMRLMQDGKRGAMTDAEKVRYGYALARAAHLLRTSPNPAHPPIAVRIIASAKAYAARLGYIADTYERGMKG